MSAHQCAQVGRCAQTRLSGHYVHRKVGALQESLREPHTLGCQPRKRGRSYFCVEVSMKRGHTGVRVARQISHGQWLFKSLLCPDERRGKRRLRCRGQRTFDELPLAAVSERAEHQSPADVIADFSPVVRAHDVQRQVQRGGTTGRCQYVPVFDEQNVRFDSDLRIALCELADELPMHGGSTPIENARFGQREGSGAQSDNAGAAGVRVANAT